MSVLSFIQMSLHSWSCCSHPYSHEITQTSQLPLVFHSEPNLFIILRLFSVQPFQAITGVCRRLQRLKFDPCNTISAGDGTFPWRPSRRLLFCLYGKLLLRRSHAQKHTRPHKQRRKQTVAHEMYCFHSADGLAFLVHKLQSTLNLLPNECNHGNVSQRLI